MPLDLGPSYFIAPEAIQAIKAWGRGMQIEPSGDVGERSTSCSNLNLLRSLAVWILDPGGFVFGGIHLLTRDSFSVMLGLKGIRARWDSILVELTFGGTRERRDSVLAGFR